MTQELQIPVMQPVLPAAMQLRPYQVRWVEDKSRFKLAVKSARIGYSFGTALEVVLDCLATQKATWTILSASKAQSVEFVEACKSILQLMGEVAELFEDEVFLDVVSGIEDYQMRVSFPNGARIIALPANPRTARGYPGNAVLDEFAHHDKSYAIWAAVIRQTALGHKLRVLSTPNGEQGKFFDLAREAGLIDGVAPPVNPVVRGPWSSHWVDVYAAVAEGCPINIEEMKLGVGDDDTWNQEFCCIFLKAVGAWLPLELIAAAESDEATIDLPPEYLVPGFRPQGFLSLGIDVGRDHDATSAWLDEKIGDVSVTRGVWWLYGMSFPEQFKKLSPIARIADRVAIDSTGMGIALYDYLNEAFPGRIIGINFAGTRPRGEKPLATSGRDEAEKSIRMKTDLAIRIKKKFEMARCRIPHSTQIRNELGSIKRESTGGGVRFDAPRIETDSAVAGGGKKKRYAHADAFWAKALADFAAETNVISTDFTASEAESNYATSMGIL
jgi:phage FluMu gp28-like protein